MANGIYMGGVGMGGEASVDIRNLAEEIKKQREAASEGYGKRKFWDTLGDVFKTVVPGYGHVADFFIDTISRQLIDVGDPSKIEEKETIWTEGQAGQYGEAFREAEDAATPSFVENMLSQLISYGATEAGEEWFGDFRTKLKEKFFPSEQKFAWQQEGFDPQAFDFQGISEPEKYGTWDELFGQGEGVDLYGNPFSMENNTMKEGGRVPKYRGGGMVQGGVPTISDYFNRQGKTLGGSNKQSLAEMLGRR